MNHWCEGALSLPRRPCLPRAACGGRQDGLLVVLSGQLAVVQWIDNSITSVCFLKQGCFSMDFTICPNCSSENALGVRYCIKCGASLSSPTPSQNEVDKLSAPELPVTDTNAKRNAWIVAAIALSVALLFVVSQIGFYTIQPIGALPQGVTLVIWRGAEEPFFNSPDAICIKVQGGVSLFCRIMVMSNVPTDRIIARLPYIELAYLISTGGYTFER